MMGYLRTLRDLAGQQVVCNLILQHGQRIENVYVLKVQQVSGSMRPGAIFPDDDHFAIVYQPQSNTKFKGMVDLDYILAVEWDQEALDKSA